MQRPITKTGFLSAIVVVLTACGGGGGGGAPAPDPAPAAVTVAIDNPNVTEGDAGTATLTFTVSLSAASTDTVSVDYSTADSTTSGDDYTAAAGTLQIAAGATSGTIDVDVAGDTTIEADEELTIALSNAVNASISNGTGVGTIINDDFPQLSIADASLAEGDAGSALLQLDVTLDVPGIGDITVDYATSNAVAQDGADYTAVNGTLTIAEGDTAATIDVPILGDNVPELDEQFTVNLLNPSPNAEIADDEAFGTVLNDDAARVSMGSANAAELDTQTRILDMPVLLDVAAEADISVDYASNPVTALAGIDFTSISGSLTIPAGETSGTVSVSILGDTLVEPSEAFSVTLSQVSGPAELGQSPIGYGTIIDNDGPPPLPQLIISNATVLEGDSGTTDMVFRVLLDQPQGSDVTFDYATMDGTAAAGSDYTPVSGAATITAGTTNTPIIVSISGDTDAEPDEVLQLVLSNQSAGIGLAVAVATGTIGNDDGSTPAQPRLSIAPTSIIEGDSGTDDMTFTVTLDKAASNTVTVDYATEEQSATAGVDYTDVSGTLTFAAGVTSQSFTVPVIGDTFTEDNETLRARLSNITGDAVLAGALANGTIITNEPIARISIDNGSVLEGDSGSVQMTFAVTLDVASIDNVLVDYASADDTATATVDYTPVTGTLTIAAGNTAGEITVDVLGDTDNEPDENFTITLSNLSSNASFRESAAIGTVVNDDGTPGWQAAVDFGFGLSPTVAMDSQGRGFAVFQSQTNPIVLDDNITAVPYSSTWLAPEIVEVVTSVVTGPSLTMIDDGGALVAYRGDGGMRASTYRPASGWSAVEVDPDFGFFVSVVGNESGDATYVFQNNGNNLDPEDIVRADYDPTADTWGAAELAENDDTGSARSPRLAIDAAGNRLLLFFLNSSDLNLNGTYYSYFDAGTGLWSAPKLEDAFDFAGSGTVSAIDNGRFGFVAQYRGFAGAPDSIELWVYDSTSDTWELDGPIESLASDDAVIPRLVADNAGNLFVSWLRNTGGGNYDAYVTRFDAATDTWEAPVLLENATGNIFPTSGVPIDTDASGNAIAVWPQLIDDNGQSQFRIRASRYTEADGTWSPPEQIDDPSFTVGAARPSIAMDDAGNAIVVWEHDVENTVGATHYRAP